MADIAAPPHVSTRALDEIVIQVSIAVVAVAGVNCSRDLDDAPAAIVNLYGCIQERQTCRNATGAITGAADAAGCVISVRQRRGIVFELS